MTFRQYFHLFLESSITYGPMYHGGNWDGKKPIHTNGKGSLGVGGYLTHNIAKAASYAEDAGHNSKIIECWVSLNNPLIIKRQTADPAADALIQLGMDKNKAMNMMESVYEKWGYPGQQIKTRAISKGYDALILMDMEDEEEISEMVIWQSDKIQKVTNIMAYK